MEDVARRAGLAVGTLYNYFSSKDQLLIALSRIDTEHLVSIGERILADPPQDPVEAISALTEVMVNGITAGGRRGLGGPFVSSVAGPGSLWGARFLRVKRLLSSL